MSRVLFVCRSNAARSQMGEALYNSMTGTRDAVSAGTAAFDYIEVPRDVRKVLSEVKAKLPRKASPKQLTPDMAFSASRILLMTDEYVPNYLRDDPKVEVWDIEDPRHVGVEGLRRARDEIRDLISEHLLVPHE